MLIALFPAPPPTLTGVGAGTFAPRFNELALLLPPAPAPKCTGLLAPPTETTLAAGLAAASLPIELAELEDSSYKLGRGGRNDVYAEGLAVGHSDLIWTEGGTYMLSWAVWRWVWV